MGYKKKVYYLLAASFIVCIAVIGTCMSSLEYLCKPSGYYGTLSFLLAYSIVVFLVSIALVFSSELVFNVWKKFFFIYLPIAVIISSITPIVSNFLSPDKQMIIWWSAGIFFIISIIIILVKREKHGVLEEEEC